MRAPRHWARTSLCARIRRRLQQEGGFTLIEVVVSAALLAVVAAGVYAGIDGPTRVSGDAKARAAAATIAQGDQERMRAMRFADLQNYAPVPQQQTIDGVRYTLTSRADWVQDSTAAAGCSTGNNQGDYLQISSSVAYPARPTKPVVLTSLLAPPVNDGTNGTGNIVIHLKDQAGAPVAGIPVTATGRATLTRTTDAQGCAVFTDVPSGNYTSTFSQSGYVDDQGNQAVSLVTPVQSGGTMEVEHLYARAASVTVSFKGSDGTTLAWTKASVAGGTLLSPKVLTGTAPLSTGKVLFPATSGSFNAWAGGCADPGATYDPSGAVTPGNDTPLTVVVPTLNLQVSTAGLPGAPHLVIKPANAACTDTFTVPAPTNSGGQYRWAVRLPYGSYKLCADTSGYMTSPSLTEANLASTGSTVQLTVTKDRFGAINGVSDGTQTVGVTPGVCS